MALAGLDFRETLQGKPLPVTWADRPQYGSVALPVAFRRAGETLPVNPFRYHEQWVCSTLDADSFIGAHKPSGNADANYYRAPLLLPGMAGKALMTARLDRSYYTGNAAEDLKSLYEIILENLESCGLAGLSPDYEIQPLSLVLMALPALTKSFAGLLVPGEGMSREGLTGFNLVFRHGQLVANQQVRPGVEALPLGRDVRGVLKSFHTDTMPIHKAMPADASSRLEFVRKNESLTVVSAFGYPEQADRQSARVNGRVAVTCYYPFVLSSN